MNEFSISLPENEKESFLNKFIGWMQAIQTNLKEAADNKTYFSALIHEAEKEQKALTSTKPKSDVISLLEEDQSINTPRSPKPETSNLRQPSKYQHSVTKQIVIFNIYDENNLCCVDVITCLQELKLFDLQT